MKLNANAKKANWLFLAVILETIVLVVLFILYPQLANMDIIASLLVNQLMLLVPAVVCILFSPEVRKALPFRRIKITSILLLAVVTYLFMPLITVVNAVSLLFVDNAANNLMGALGGYPSWQLFLVIGVIGPISEEFVFRGVIYHSYRTSGRMIAAGVLSAVLFGVMHLNFNQMSYAILVGIIGVILIEVTGSLFSAMIFHMIINSNSLFLSLMLNNTNAGLGAQTQEQLQAQVNLSQTEMMSVAIFFYIVLACVTVPVAICLLFVIAKNEGQIENIKMSWQNAKKNKSYRLFSIPLMIALVLGFIYMILGVFATG